MNINAENKCIKPKFKVLQLVVNISIEKKIIEKLSKKKIKKRFKKKSSIFSEFVVNCKSGFLL